MSDQQPLKILTYLVPGLRIELFEIFAQYLEASLKQDTMLIYESRFNGPPADRVDLFSIEAADIAFVTGASYERLLKDKKKLWEFLPVGGVFQHFLRGETAGYFADIIINKSIKERIKDLLDLRGSNWATNGSASTSGHFVMLKLLKERGENPSFFGSVLDSGSHMGSIQMVASKQADIATVDSNVLAYALAHNPSLRDDICIFESHGPLPTYPILIRASLPEPIKQAVCEALLKMDQVSPWNQRFASFRLTRFIRTSNDVYLKESETRDSLANLSASVRYY